VAGRRESEIPVRRQREFRRALPVRAGDLKAKGEPETIVDKDRDTSGGHVTRTLAFSKDGKTCSCRSARPPTSPRSIGATPPQPLAQWEAKHGLGGAWGEETDRATVLAFDPDGKNRRNYANGLRNCVGMLVHPTRATCSAA
jgi:glucose/arabinose dehydrogenase